MSKKTSMYDWNIAMQKKGLAKFAKEFAINRMQDDDRLEKSGLPFFHKFVTDYNSFSKKNKELIEFIDAHNEFMVRVLPIPGEKKLPRRFKRGGIYTFEHCKNFINELFEKDKELKGKEKFYRISLSETEVNLAGGNIISTPRRLIVEAKIEKNGKGGLSGLCYGEDPDLTGVIDFVKAGHLEDKTSWIPEKSKLKPILLKAVSYIELTRDNFNPLYKRGYFEWLYTVSKRIVFWDYKIQEFFQV